jgi:superfamily I DNA/RNA helicase
MSTWLIPLNELSNAQREAVEVNAHEHRIIGGAPGSGKTQILLHRARHLLDQYGVDCSKLRIFIFTNVLRDYIQSALDLLNLPESCVSTFDAWCCDFHERNISRSLPWNHEEKTRDYARIREAVWQRLQRADNKKREYEFVLVDEAQDLQPVSFNILNAISRHVTVCIDHKQQIYDCGSSDSEVVQRLGLKRANVTLLETFRCSPYIIDLAGGFIPHAQERAAFIRQNRVAPAAEKETPLLYLAEDFDDERDRLIEVVKTRQAKGERIAILLPSKRQVFGFAKGLTESGLQVEIRKEVWRKEAELPPLDFTSDLPKLMTYHSAKGLTFDSVLLPRLVRGGFRRSTIPETNLLFVGTTRATKWVFLSAQQGKEMPAIQALWPLEAEGKLTIQTRQNRLRTSTGAAQAGRTQASPTRDEGIGDLL